MSSERNFGVSQQVNETSAERIRRMDNSRRALSLSPDYERIPGSSRPADGMSAQCLARMSITHDIRRIDEHFSVTESEYNSQEMIAAISPIPLRIAEDGTIIYA